jgi:hypothetical protein
MTVCVGKTWVSCSFAGNTVPELDDEDPELDDRDPELEEPGDDPDDEAELDGSLELDSWQPVTASAASGSARITSRPGIEGKQKRIVEVSR